METTRGTHPYDIVRPPIPPSLSLESIWEDAAKEGESLGLRGRVPRAPGEAKAKLAMLNMMGMIDAIISEDSNCLVFGGLCVIHLQNTKDAGDQVTIITTDAARSHTHVLLTREGMFLFGILGKGDYSKAAQKLAQSDLAVLLFRAALELPKRKLVDFLADWREDFKLLLADDQMGLLGQRYPALVKAVGNTFPSADVVALYAQPVTLWSCGRAPDTSNWTLRLPDLCCIGALSEKSFSLASQDNIFLTFSSNVWEGILIRDLLKRAVNPDPTPRYTNNGFYSGHILKIRGIKLGLGLTRYHPDVPGFRLSVSTHMLAHDTISALPNDCNKPECPPGLQVMNAWVPLQILETALLALVQHYFTAHPTAVIVQHWTSILPDVAVPGDDDNDTSSVSSTPLSSGSDTEIPVAGPSDTHGSSSHNAIVIMDDNEDGDVKEYTTVKNTESSYNGQIACGRAFLKVLIDGQRAKGKEVCKDRIVTNELAKAFNDSGPNEYSATALELFLVHKCFLQERGLSTASSIHGAFAAFWDEMGDGQYSGAYSLDKETGKLKELDCLMQWSLKECPDDLLNDDSLILDIETLRFCVEHALMQAFMSSAFMLWTRCFELLSLQQKDLAEGCKGPSPHFFPHFKVHLTHRKGWQQEKGYDGPRTSNVYDIYKQDITAIDMNFHLMRWKNLLERLYGSKLEDEDCLFPYISPNGVIHIRRQTSYDMLQASLTKFCNGAGVSKRYTTHSFHRGGAQYQFMFAPIGQWWTLNRIHWWGGWAVGEHVDTLIKYLVDSLQSYENGHGDALHPIPIEKDITLLGDHVRLAPATNSDISQLRSSFLSEIQTKIQTLSTTINSQLSAIAETASATHLPTHEVTVQRSMSRELRSAEIAPYPPTKFRSSVQLLASQSPGPEVDAPALHESLPLSKVSIPDLGQERGTWRQAIFQWMAADGETGLALKDWPLEWYMGSMRTIMGSKHNLQQVVYKEYARLGASDARFLEVYPEAEKSLTDLVNLIRKRNKKIRASKNSSPAFQASSADRA
ncbi:unnamed protein product [Cyclocybe aegerita]|uniref:XPG-I domain-containing protein n=1 Tax=Cyclocybe aegerita TaxID=1973307 RepID=A0A8S0VQS7_CYCAE|nr:unnamed protein product [Cyclocybe aegerita]